LLDIERDPLNTLIRDIAAMLPVPRVDYFW